MGKFAESEKNKQKGGGGNEGVFDGQYIDKTFCHMVNTHTAIP